MKVKWTCTFCGKTVELEFKESSMYPTIGKEEGVDKLTTSVVLEADHNCNYTEYFNKITE